MPFDAADLYWPPFRSLYAQLEAIKLEPEAVDPASLKSSLQEYTPWLTKGLGGFKKPNETSRKALETETQLLVGAQKLPVEAGLRNATLATSRALNLDEVQSYILLRRWYRQAVAGTGSDAPHVADGQLNPQQLQEVCVLYSQERLCLLQSLEDLLWLGEGALGDGPFQDVVEDALGTLLGASPGLEETTAESLKTNLEAGAVEAASRGLGLRASQQEEERALERNVLLTVLMLVYFHPRKQCTPTRFLELAHLFHWHMFMAPQRPDKGGNRAPPSPADLSIKLATLLLLEVLALDVDKPLELLAAGADVTPDTIPFLAPDVESSVDKELQSWWPIARSAHGPIFLIWSAFLTLGGRQGAEEYAGKASEVGALGALCRLSSTQGLHPSAAEMAGTIMFSSMAAVLAAYGLEPLSIGVPATEQVVTVLVNIFQGQERLCSSFWEDPDAVSNQPIRHFLDGLAELFPALPVPMLRLLKALATGQSAAAHANAYLANMARLCSLHTLPDSAIAAYPNDSGAIVTEHALLMPGAPTLSIPAGVVGEILELPPEAPGGWTSGPEHVTDSQHLIKWRLSVPEGTAQWVLLCRSFGALRAVQTWRSAAALAELDAALGLLAALCAGDAGTALDLLHVEAPAGEGAGAEGVRGADALVLASQTVAVLAEAIAQQQFDDPGPASSALAHALKLCMAYASAAPGRVGQELCSALGVSPLNTSLATLVPGGTQEPALLRAFIMGEGAGRQYAATQALLQLLSALVQAACPTPSLAALVAFVLQRVMPEMHHWRFDDWTERWRLATLCLTLTRHVLLLASSEGSSASPVAAVVTSVLQTDAGAAACLLPLAPPEASALESMAQNRQFAREAEAAETCCIAWLRLIPVLLPLASPDAALAAGPLLRSGMDGGRPVAATLLSFLLYPYFSTRERTLVVRCLHCFAVAAARVVSDMPLVALLPQGAAGLSPAAKAVFELAVGPVGARSSQGLFGATCDVLVASIKHHASLLDALMFPSEMATSADKENKSDNTSIVGPAKEGSKKKVKPARSCLDALWSLLQQSQDLAVNDPFILAKALQVVAALWQSGGPGASSLALLQQQDGFWKMLVGVIEGGVGADAAFAVPADRGAQQPAAWTELRNDCWRVTAEAYALQIIAGELFAWAAAAGSEESNQSAKGGTAPPEVADFATNRVAAVLPYLLERYCKLLPTSSVVADTQRVAAAAGLQLLSTAVENEVLWVTLQSGSSLVSSLSALVQPSLARCGSSGEAAAELVRQYNDLLAEGGRLQTPALRAVAELMLAQAEVPPRVASDGEYGAAFVYDAALFGRRVGAALAHEASLLGDLREWLGACSIAVSLEDARLTAALAVDALVRVMDGQVGTAPKAGQRLKLAASTEHFMSALDVLDAAVEAVVQEAKAAAAPLDSSTPSVPAIDAKEVHVSSLAAAAQVCLVLCARHRPNDHAIATSLVARSLQSASVWLSADQDVARVDADAAGRTTKCLLAIALHSVSAASPKEAVSLSPAAQGAERAAHQLLPSLLRLVSASGGDFVVPAASLACVLLEKVLAPSSWIPILERGINLTSALTAAFTTPPTPSDTSLSPHQATSSPADATSPQEALLLLALQAAQVSDGAVMLVDQGMPALLVSLCAWLQSPPPGGSLMGESPSAAVDYSNAYAADGTPLLAQRLWCCVLALTGLLLAALPGHAAVEGAALQVVLSMDARLQLALAPPEATARQPVTLAMAQEAKYALFLLCSVSKFAGQWRLAMPTALPALRRASASLLRFLAGGLFEGAVCCPVSRAERAAAAGDGPTQLLGGWFKQCSEVASAGGAHDGRRGTSDAACSSFGWDVAEKLCSCVQFALGFQLETAPEVSEAELPSLGPEWVGPNAVRVLLDSFHETVAGAVGLGKGLSPAGHRVLRSATSVLKACMQLASLLCIRLSGATVQEVQEALAAAEDILETRNAV